MKKIIILFVCFFVGNIFVKADVCGAGENWIKIQGRNHCIGVSVTQEKKENVLVNFNVYYYDDIYYIALSKSDLIAKGIDKKPLTINTYLYDDMNLENSENSFGIMEKENGKKEQYELSSGLIFKGSFEIVEDNDSYESKTKYTAYENINCIEETLENPYEYCRTTIYTKPTFIVTIVDDTNWNIGEIKKCDCENQYEQEECEQTNCDEPLTFVEYLTTHNPLLITIILITIILVTISIIYIVKYVPVV